MAMRQEQQLDQDKQQSSASIDKDPGPKITLAEFIAAVYGLDPDKLYYNWFGRLSPLPPQAQELHMLLAKRIQVISRDTFGCTVRFGNEECTNIRIKDINKECWNFTHIGTVYIEHWDTPFLKHWDSPLRRRAS